MANPLPRCNPSVVDVDSAGILGFLQALEARSIDLHSYMLLRDGQVVSEGAWAPFDAVTPHVLYSLSKSFTSTAVGFAVAEGRFSLDDRVVSFFPDDLPPTVSPNLAAMKVRHLLSMSAGQASDEGLPLRDTVRWAAGFLAREVPHEPGTSFLYNSTATYMCSAIVQKTTGQRLSDYLRPRLFDPIGIGETTWEQCPRGIDVGGWGLCVNIDAIARFGQLYLQDGVWEGRRILPEGWVAEATRAHVSNGDDPESDWSQGYGFQFWRCRHRAYRGDGAFGQYCVVMPEQRMVLAILSSIDDMQVVLNEAWNHLLPAIGRGSDAALADLRATESALVLRGPAGASVGPNRVPATYRFEDWPGVETVQAEFADGQTTLRFGDSVAVARNDRWSPAQWPDLQGRLFARAAWNGEALSVKLADVGSPYEAVWTLRFAGEELHVSSTSRGWFGGGEGPKFVGRRL